MKIFNKLVNILFDEQEEEIPVITKSTNEKKETKKPVEDAKDEVLVTKVERPVSTISTDDDLFDMPKFKEETEIEKETTKTFNFPAIDDEDFGIFEEKRTTKKSEKKEKKEGSRFDFLSSTDYKKSSSHTSAKESSYDSSYGQDDKDKKPFTLSPIISPVYGILNENYKKEDIVTRDNSQNRSKTEIDLDEVRKKAYGTLEDEISESLSKKTEEIVDIKPTDEDKLLNTLSDDGISIDDLLGDEYKEEVFDKDKVTPMASEEKEENSEEPVITDDGDDDLFDLIDSIYSGKENEQ